MSYSLNSSKGVRFRPCRVMYAYTGFRDYGQFPKPGFLDRIPFGVCFGMGSEYRHSIGTLNPKTLNPRP